jgi:hypothetical protein
LVDGTPIYGTPNVRLGVDSFCCHPRPSIDWRSKRAAIQYRRDTNPDVAPCWNETFLLFWVHAGIRQIRTPTKIKIQKEGRLQARVDVESVGAKAIAIEQQFDAGFALGMFERPDISYAQYMNMGLVHEFGCCREREYGCTHKQKSENRDGAACHENNVLRLLGDGGWCFCCRRQYPPLAPIMYHPSNSLDCSYRSGS